MIQRSYPGPAGQVVLVEVLQQFQPGTGAAGTVNTGGGAGGGGASSPSVGGGSGGSGIVIIRYKFQ